MCNCGSSEQTRPAVATPARSHVRRVPAPEPVIFEYIGATALTVHGPFSGLRYRFGSPGASVSVDGRDAASLSAIRSLRRVPSLKG